MSWNYRVVRDVHECGEPECVEEEFSIREVYYGKGGEIGAWSSERSAPSGETPEELADDLAKFQRALTEPVVDVSSGKAVVLEPTRCPDCHRLGVYVRCRFCVAEAQVGAGLA